MFDDVTRIKKILSLGKGKPGLIIVDVGDNPAAAALCNPVIEGLAREAGYNAISIDVRQFDNVYDLLLRLEDESKNGCQFAILDFAGDWLSERLVRVDSRGRSVSATRLGDLNALRENFFRVPMMLALPLSPQGIREFAETAIDFYSWRKGTYVVQPAPGMRSPDYGRENVPN